MTLVTLLTDFGSGSPYPAEMKGVLGTLCRATITDITHEIAPHNIAHGAYVLVAAVRAFPAGTVHLAVVDPGVGADRRALAIASGGQFFVGPDNGLLIPAARSLGDPRALALDLARGVRRPIAPTFHGRDVFAPAAAALAEGLPIGHLGVPIIDPVELREDPAERSTGSLQGYVVYQDPFGNLVTNIPGAWIEDLAARPVLEHARGRHAVRRARTYADGDGRELLVLVGSGGTLEIAVNSGSAAAAVGLRPGDVVAIGSS